MYNYLVVDAECNGLYGRIFAIAALWTVNGKICEHYTARCPIEGPIEPWVEQHILPALEVMPITHLSYSDMLSSFHTFCEQRMRHRSRVLTFIGYPVEAKLFRDIYGATEELWFDGPFPMLDLSSILHDRGEDDTDLEGYMERHRLMKPTVGQQHNPLYDVWATWTVFAHLKGFDS